MAIQEKCRYTYRLCWLVMIAVLTGCAILHPSLPLPSDSTKRTITANPSTPSALAILDTPLSETQTQVSDTHPVGSKEPETLIMPTRLPDLLFTYGYTLSCGLAKRKIFISSWPYHETRELSDNTSLDFNAPTFSPNGKWIAYLVSDPKIIQEGSSDRQPGKGWVAVMRSDGSQK